MSDGHWEAIRGDHRESKGDTDSEHAAADAVAAALAGRAGSRVNESDEIIVGWRVWALSGVAAGNASNVAQPVVLTSTFMTDVWRPGKVMTACCGPRFLRHGVHAFMEREQTREYIAQTQKPLRYVFGEVSLWGRVVVHERGYRATHAYPRRILVPKLYRGGRDYVNELRRAYGVEAEWAG